MERLQDVVSKYNFAQHNGYSYQASGLPDLYGARLSVTYATGETIYACDNQSNFIPLDAIHALIDLFAQQR